MGRLPGELKRFFPFRFVDWIGGRWHLQHLNDHFAALGKAYSFRAEMGDFEAFCLNLRMATSQHN